VAGALAVTAQSVWRADPSIVPAVSSEPAPSSTASPSPTTSASPEVAATITVSSGPRIDRVAEQLAEDLFVTTDEALAAITDALPPEADGHAEGWVGAGTYRFLEGDTVADAASAMVEAQLTWLEEARVPRDAWRRTLVVASIVEQETPNPSQMAMVARVIENRLEAGMTLDVQSPLAYDLRADEHKIGDDGWAVDTPYNSYIHEGLPPTPVGAPTREALAAAVDPAPGDWMYFLVDPDTGSTQFFVTFEEFAVAVDELHPGTGASE